MALLLCMKHIVFCTLKYYRGKGSEGPVVNDLVSVRARLCHGLKKAWKDLRVRASAPLCQRALGKWSRNASGRSVSGAYIRSHLSRSSSGESCQRGRLEDSEPERAGKLRYTMLATCSVRRAGREEKKERERMGEKEECILHTHHIMCT